jgi:outer membrane protein assembly factor BamB
MSRWFAGALLSVLILLAVPAAAARPPGSSPAGCAPGTPSGGEWPLLNQGLRNERAQPAEDRIGPAEAPGLVPAWTFDAASVGAPGGMRSTPIVAYGCVFLGFGQGYLGDRGDVVALDVRTGELVWHTEIDGSVLGLAAANGLIYATPSRGTRGDVAMPVVTGDYTPAGSYAVALDARSGVTRWTSERLDDGNPANGTFVNASPVAFQAGPRRLLFVALSGGSGDGARVPMYFLDALSGATVRRAFTLSDDEYATGYGGTGIWSTAAYDQGTRHLYVGTADSDGHTRQHPYNNAILKIDADPRRVTFGTVVGHHTGTTEHAGLDDLVGNGNNPLCGLLAGAVGIDPPTFFDTSAAPECLELDLDFGASPNLYEDSAGRLKVGALQKSGVFHSVDAGSMDPDWTFFVGSGGAFNNSATAAVDDQHVYLGATPNLLFGVGQERGALRWVSTTDLDLFAYQPLTLANGVLYGINDSGFLLAFDAATGLPLLRRTLALDGAFENCLGAGAGVAVARHMVFAPCDAGGLSDLAGVEGPPGGLVAYRLPS